ncbi:MAG: hypothetical protein LBR23_09475 [Spirochaetaceae bacterium]|jgi:hypothetical protein|nr:hypothetical protein [Spirochaetaceae bacterium]
MKVIDLKDITRKDSAVYYRRYFSARAVLDLPGGAAEAPVEFAIETSPLSQKTVTVKVDGQVDYPLLPVINELKALVLSRDEAGALPL